MSKEHPCMECPDPFQQYCAEMVEKYGKVWCDENAGRLRDDYLNFRAGKIDDRDKPDNLPLGRW